MQEKKHRITNEVQHRRGNTDYDCVPNLREFKKPISEFYCAIAAKQRREYIIQEYRIESAKHKSAKFAPNHPNGNSTDI